MFLLNIHIDITEWNSRGEHIQVCFWIWAWKATNTLTCKCQYQQARGIIALINKYGLIFLILFLTKYRHDTQVTLGNIAACQVTSCYCSGTLLFVFLAERGRESVCMCVFERERERGTGGMWKRKSTCDESEETDSDVILQPSVSAWLLLNHIPAFTTNKLQLRILLYFALFVFHPLSFTSSRDVCTRLIFLVYFVEARHSFHNTVKTAPHPRDGRYIQHSKQGRVYMYVYSICQHSEFYS